MYKDLDYVTKILGEELSRQERAWADASKALTNSMANNRHELVEIFEGQMKEHDQKVSDVEDALHAYLKLLEWVKWSPVEREQEKPR